MIEVEKSNLETVANAEGARVDVPAFKIPQLELQPDAVCSDAECYQLDELLCYHDRPFVTHAYAALRKRAPTAAELARTLDDLRSGRHNKIEIIENLVTTQVDGQPVVRVADLPSPIMRRISRWPVVGYAVRMFRALARLPVLIRHQQQFEAYSMARQQHIVDYLNEVFVPAISHLAEGVPEPHLAARVAEAVETVMMLSDSLVELSGRLAELQAQVQNLHAQHERSEAQFYTNLVALTESYTGQERRLDELRRAHDESVAAQREFLVQEQRVIVEAQKVALGDIQDQIRELAGEQKVKHAELAKDVRRLQVLIEGSRAGAPPGPAGPEREQV